MKAYPFYLAGTPTQSENSISVHNPENGNIIYEVDTATIAQAEEAVQAACVGFQISRKLPVWKRAEVLNRIAQRLEERKVEIAQTICLEAGKPIQYARTEVDRAIQTFKLASAWTWNQQGELLDLSHAPGLEGKMGLVKYFPSGPCLLISPFNFPLNLVAHKVAPAIATGNAFVLKPASATPRTALILAEIIAETEYPKEAWSVLPCTRTVGQYLVEHPLFTILSFTGSPEVGWKMKADAGKKKVILELGGDAAVVLDDTANLEDALPKIIQGAYAYAGQICISIQRIITTKEIYSEVINKLRLMIPNTPTGSTLDPTIVCGPMIDEANTQRTLTWIQEAIQSGAQLICGGTQSGHNLILPTLLENIPAGVQLSQKEAFAPVAGIQVANSFEEAIDLVNQSSFGLQTGIFTQKENRLKYAFEHLEVGGLIHNNAPTLRIDAMPYGGVKDSGMGREGIAYACKDFCEPKVMVW